MRCSMRYFVLAVYVSSLFTARVGAQPMAELRNEAKNAFRAGDYDKAFSLYQELVKGSPERLNIRKEAMWAFWNMGRIPEAQAMATAVKGLSPDDIEAGKILGWAPSALNRNKISDMHAAAKAAYQKGNYNEAARLFSEITALDPQNITMLRDRMWILWNMKRTGEAAAIAEKVLRLRPGDRDAQSILDRAPSAEMRVKRNTPASEEMIADLRKKISADPDNAGAQRQLAWSLFNTGRVAEAEESLKEFLNRNPDNAEMWRQLGKIQQGRGDEAAAQESFAKSLEYDPNQPQLLSALGRRSFGDRNLDDSVKYFERAVALGSVESKELLPILGKSLFYRGEFRRSAEAWSQAVEAFPDRSDYRYHEAEAMFYAGDEGLALAKMRQLKYEYREPQAIAFLVDNAVARGDFGAAAVILAEDLDKLSIDKGRKVVRLAQIYVKLNRLNNAISLLKRWITFVPRDVWALLTLGSIQRDAMRFEDAIETYARVLRLNPRVIEAHIGTANAYFGLGDQEKGIEFLGKALALEPTDYHMIIDYASALYNNGQRRRARQMLQDWVTRNASLTPLPILLYHGLTPFDDSPMLGYEIHSTITAFESQMRGLSEAGYESITMAQLNDWYEGNTANLPEKPVFISFDDARMDSFRYADPILDQYGFEATMFVPLDDVESFGSIGYANWAKIKEYQQSGRWHLQAHGGHAHSKIDADSRGRKMLYLVMPQWLPSQGRVETEDEWRERIEQDHLLIKRRLKQNCDVTPIGYAWPEGNYGEHSDSQTAIENNIGLIKKHFKYAFIQDQFGINSRSQDSYFLHRIEPPKEWSGKDLVSHLANKNPVALFYRELLQMSIEEKKFAEANQWLEKLKAAGISENSYLAEKARINYASGRSSQAYQLALQSFTADPTPEVQKMLIDFKSKLGLAWRPELMYQHDNEGRESLRFEQELEIPLANQVKGLLHHSRTKYREEQVENQYVTELGGGVQLGWGDGHMLEGVVFQQLISGPGLTDDRIGYSANYWARWTDEFQTRLETGRHFTGGALAIANDIRESMYRLTVHWGDKEDWGVRANGRFLDYSDKNERKSGELEAGLEVGKKTVSWGPVYRYSYDDTKKLSDFYFSPQDLNIHELGPQFVYAPKQKLKLVARYLPGYSKESGHSTRFVQNAEASLMWAITQNTSMTPSFYYEETGTYYYTLGSVSFEVRF